jgi:3-deoxy-D-manno-octulosonic-acid transferase
MDAAVGMIVYSTLLAAGLALSGPWWLWRMATSGRYRTGLGQRLGRVPPGLRRAVADKRVIWVHCVSVGEMLAAERLIHELAVLLGGAWQIVVSTTTATGQRLARERFPDLPVFFLPLDFAFTLRPWMRALHPSMVVLLESELWPRWLDECQRDGIPVVVANARMSDRSFRRAVRVRSLWLRMAAKVTLFLPQGGETAARLRHLGVQADRTRVSGNLKYDAPAIRPTPLVETVQRSLPPEAELVICGSTLEDEEALILDAWSSIQNVRPNARLLLAPRHPQRFDTVARLIGDRGIAVTRLSGIESEIPGDSILLLDTLGALAAMYSLATVAFVGGSLVDRGGHNPLEPARFGVPVLIGESFANFREIVRSMLAADAIRLVSRAGLADAVTSLLSDGKPMGQRGRQFFDAQSGATRITVEAILQLLGERG